MDKGNGNYSRSDFVFHAYCVSYMLCKQYGVDTNGYRFEQAPQMLEGLEAQQIRSELSVIRDAAGEITNRMKRMLEQQRQQKVQEPQR